MQDVLDKLKHMCPSLSWLPIPESAGGGFSASLATPPDHEGSVLVIQRQQGGPGLVDATSPWDLKLVDTEAKEVHALGTCDGLHEKGGRCVLTQGELLEACGKRVMRILAERLFATIYPPDSRCGPTFGHLPAVDVIIKCGSPAPWRADMRSKAVSKDQQVVLSGMSGSSCRPPPLNMEDAADLIAMLKAAEVLRARRGGGGTTWRLRRRSSGSASGSEGVHSKRCEHLGCKTLPRAVLATQSTGSAASARRTPLRGWWT